LTDNRNELINKALNVLMFVKRAFFMFSLGIVNTVQFSKLPS